MFHRGEAVILRPVILEARGVAEKLADRDLIPLRDAGDVSGDRVIERELALILEQQQRGGGELLRDRSDLIGHVGARGRSEEHTSELQSLMRSSYAVFCLKKTTERHTHALQRHEEIDEED